MNATSIIFCLASGPPVAVAVAVAVALWRLAGSWWQAGGRPHARAGGGVTALAVDATPRHGLSTLADGIAGMVGQVTHTPGESNRWVA